MNRNQNPQDLRRDRGQSTVIANLAFAPYFSTTIVIILSGPRWGQSKFTLPPPGRLYPEGAHGFGHVGFGLPWDGDYTYGLYPTTNPFYSPGEILPDDQYFESECIDYPSTPTQDQCMQKCRTDVRVNNEWYSLPTYSCYIFTHICLIECGVTPWSIPSPFPSDAMYDVLNPSVNSGYGVGVGP